MARTCYCPDCGEPVECKAHVAEKLDGKVLCDTCAANRAELKLGV